VTRKRRSDSLKENAREVFEAMQLSRRHAAAGLLAIGGTALPWSRAFAQAQPDAPNPTEDLPTRLDTGRDAFEHMMAPVTING
jgi:hypothetical protein